MPRLVGFAIVDRDGVMRGWAADKPLADMQRKGNEVTRPQGAPWTVRPLRYADDDVNTDEGTK